MESPLLHRWVNCHSKDEHFVFTIHYVPRMARCAASQPLLLAGPLDAGPVVEWQLTKPGLVERVWGGKIDPKFDCHYFDPTCAAGRGLCTVSGS